MCEGHKDIVSTPANRLGRRDFLKRSAAGVSGILLAGTLGFSRARGQSSEEGSERGGPDGSLMQEFRDAAEEFGVPAGLLVAMGYVNTRWDMPSAKASEYEEGDIHGWGGYGIMALVRNPSTDTLGEASKLTGIPENELKTDRRSNIRGGAALLAESRRSMGKDTLAGARARQSLERADLDAGELGEWVETVSGKGAFTALGASQGAAAAGVGGGEVYAEQVSAVLQKGVSERAPGGERITLPAQEISDRVLERIGVS